MANNIKHYFVCANSSKGFKNFFSSNLQHLDKVYILKGGPGTGKSSLMKKIGATFLDEGYDIEHIHCSSDPDSLDGVIIRKLGIAIVDGTAPHIIEPTAPGALEEYINLGIAWNLSMLEKNKKEILYLQKEISGSYPKAYAHFANALAIHDEWEKIYISNMNFDKANELATKVINEILMPYAFQKEALIIDRFFGATSFKGPIDFVPNIIEPIQKRYYIKGRPGSGKSTLLKKLVLAAKSKGINAEVYHCGFDPDSLDMVLLPELNTCIFDSTAPHEYEPDLNKDHLIDMYGELITPNTDETYKEQLDDITKRYKSSINNGIAELTYAKTLHDDLEKYYISATNFNIIDQICVYLVTKIKSRH